MKVNNLDADMMHKIQQATKHCNLKQTMTIVERLQIEFRRQYEEDTEYKYDFVEVAKIIRAYKTFGTHVRIYKDLRNPDMYIEVHYSNGHSSFRVFKFEYNEFKDTGITLTGDMKLHRVNKRILADILYDTQEVWNDALVKAILPYAKSHKKNEWSI